MRFGVPLSVLACTFALTLGDALVWAIRPTTRVELARRDQIQEPSHGYKEDYFYYFDLDNPGVANFTNDDRGDYSLQWKGNGYVIGGKGWNPGSDDRVITYNGTYLPNGVSDVGVIGWTRSPLVQYFILESWGYLGPMGSVAGTKKGSSICNGATYDVILYTSVDRPSIDGIKTFPQYWSNRVNRKNPTLPLVGEIDVACHFNAWKNLGLSIGSEHNYQIFAVDGYFGSGSAKFTVT